MILRMEWIGFREWMLLRVVAFTDIVWMTVSWRGPDPPLHRDSLAYIWSGTEAYYWGTTMREKRMSYEMARLVVHPALLGDLGLTSHPNDKAIRVKCLAQGHNSGDSFNFLSGTRFGPIIHALHGIVPAFHFKQVLPQWGFKLGTFGVQAHAFDHSANRPML